MQLNYWWVAIVPSATAIILAVKTKRVIPSLFVAVWLGSFLQEQTLLASMTKTVDNIVSVLLEPSNLHVILFLYIFSGLVMLIKTSGGVDAFANSVSRFITNKKQTLALLWGLLPVTFIDCGFRVVATESIIRPLANKYSIAKERLAYMLNNSASPVIILLPFANTFVAYVLGVINSATQNTDITVSTFDLFLRAIPYNFFSFTAIAIALLSIAPAINFSNMKARIKKDTSTKQEMDISDEDADRTNILNLIVPIAALIALSFYLMWSLESASQAMLVAVILATIITVIMYLLQKIALGTLVDKFIEGGNELMNTITILVLAWPLSAISQDLGLADIITTQLGSYLPPFLVPVVIFILTGSVAYFIGSSWGSWAIMMPAAIPLALSTGISIPLAIAATLSGGTFGDVTSPVSGMTIMSSGVTDAEHMSYIRAMSPYNFSAAILAALLFVLTPLLQA